MIDHHNTWREAKLKFSSWPTLELIDPPGKQNERYDVVVLLLDNNDLSSEQVWKRATELSLPIEGFADDPQPFRAGYPKGSRIAFIGKLAKPGRMRKNPNIISRQRDFLTKLAGKIKSHGKNVLIDCTFLEINPEFFDAFFSALYEYDCYKTEPSHVTTVHIIKRSDSWDNGIEEAYCVAKWTYFARDMVNHHPDLKPPLATAHLLESRFQNAKASMVTGEEIKEYELIWAVGKSAPDHPPVLLRVEYSPPNAVNSKPVVIIGKGVIYDQGGISIKTNDSDLAIMKLDCSGAMNAAALFGIVTELSLAMHIIMYLPLVFNLTSASATKPGTVAKDRLGTFIEISDTDAEGRLILRDVVAEAAKNDDPEMIITMASLAGKTESALGDIVSAVFTESRTLSRTIRHASIQTEEMIAEFPLFRPLFEDLRGIALQNYSHSWPEGDPIRAACFLLEPALKRRIPALHLDFCGPAFLRRPRLWYPEGATGWGIRLMYEFLKRFASSQKTKTA